MNIKELFKQYYKPLRANLRRHSGMSADAEDIAQEVFLRLLRYPDSEITINPVGYLFTIGANLANERRGLKQNRVQKDSEWLDELITDPCHEPQNMLEQEQQDQLIERIIDSMPTRRGVIVLLHTQDGLTYPQIAKDLGISERIVLRELVKAYATLREEFFK